MKGGRNVGKEKGREEDGKKGRGRKAEKKGEGETQEGKKARRKGGKEGSRIMGWKEIRKEGMNECRKKEMKFGPEVESAGGGLSDSPFWSLDPRDPSTPPQKTPSSLTGSGGRHFLRMGTTFWDIGPKRGGGRSTVSSFPWDSNAAVGG